MGRRVARSSLMKCLYMMEITQDYSAEQLQMFFEHQSLAPDEREYIEKCYDLFLTHKENIDEYILQALQGWSFGRLAKIDLSIMRIAICEMQFYQDLPVEVAINEAIEIAKQYSTDDSYRFINGVLATVSERLKSEGKLSEG